MGFMRTAFGLWRAGCRVVSHGMSRVIFQRCWRLAAVGDVEQFIDLVVEFHRRPCCTEETRGVSVLWCQLSEGGAAAAAACMAARTRL